MKRILLMGCLVGTLSSWASADPQTMSGCGLGYMLLSHDSHSRLIQVTAVTTNGTSGSQTFGITSGTSGCNEDGAVSLNKQTQAFAEANFDTLRREIAAGRGEYVETFASLLDADPAHRPAMLSKLQSEYTALFPSLQTTPDEMIRVLDAKLKA